MYSLKFPLKNTFFTEILPRKFDFRIFSSYEKIVQLCKSTFFINISLKKITYYSTSSRGRILQYVPTCKKNPDRMVEASSREEEPNSNLGNFTCPVYRIFIRHRLGHSDEPSFE